MSSPRYRWWSYIKAIIRAYPALKKIYAGANEPSMAINLSGMPGGTGTSRPTENFAMRDLPTEQREYEAVRQAISIVERCKDSRSRLEFIDLVYWKQSHTFQGAAQRIPISSATAWRYSGDFIRLVAQCYGMDMKG